MIRAIIVTSAPPYPNNPRLIKEIKALQERGYKVSLIYWDREELPLELKSEELENCEIISFRYKTTKDIRRLFSLPIWFSFITLQLLKRKMDILHAINLDSIFPVIIVGKLKNTPVIYEMYDVIEDTIILPKWLRKIVVFIDKFLMAVVDAVIIVDEIRIKELGGIPNNNTVVIYNSPPKIIGIEDSLVTKGDVFTIFYAGTLNRKRLAHLDKMFRAMRDLDNVKLVIAGSGDQVEEIQKWEDRYPEKIEYLGSISYNEVIKRTSMADLLFALYDPAIRINKYGSPNKLFEAMMCGKPIIVSEGTSMADIVKKHDCGIVVDCRNVAEIREAIIKLKNNLQLSKQLGENGKKAYEREYNWKNMERKLYFLYEKLFSMRDKSEYD